jgi:3-hydroxybutyryl-CoA dehydrogenase
MARYFKLETSGLKSGRHGMKLLERTGVRMAVIGVVGLGVMGLGIAQVFAAHGHRVIATDGHAPVRETAKDRMAQSLQKRVAAGRLAAADMAATLALFDVVEGLDGLAPCDLVIEAIAEKLEAKQALFTALEAVLAVDAVLATNTSALSVTDMAKGLARPDRLLGLHFFNPAPAMKLVELVVRKENAPDALDLARSLTTAAGKTVIQCADRPGFIVNRCARPYYGEALAMLEEGQSALAIDGAMLAAGYRLGPFGLIDLIGADINLAATKGLRDAMGGHPRYYLFQSLVDQVANGRLGIKTEQGFLTGVKVEPRADDAIVRRIEATLANEAASLLDEGGVRADAIDQAMGLALNFPRGPFTSARRWGLDVIRAELEELAQNAPAHLQGRYSISQALQAIA